MAQAVNQNLLPIDYAVDITCGTMRLAVISEQDMTDLDREELDKIRQELTSNLTGDQDFGKQLLSFREQLLLEHPDLKDLNQCFATVAKVFKRGENGDKIPYNKIIYLNLDKSNRRYSYTVNKNGELHEIPQEIVPLNLQVYHQVDIDKIPQTITREKPFDIMVGPYDYYATSLDENSILERLDEYDEFKGSVVHAVVNGPPPKDGMHATFVEFERVWPNPEGSWAWEASYNLLRAPRLAQSGWHREPIATLISVKMHYTSDPSDEYKRFMSAGGVRPWGEGDNYYLSIFTIDNTDRTIPAPVGKVDFELGIKQGLRVELYYDPYNSNKSTIRAFQILYNGEQRYLIFIGQSTLAANIPVIRGEIVWLGAYLGYPVKGYEVVAGEAKILR